MPDINPSDQQRANLQAASDAANKAANAIAGFTVGSCALSKLPTAAAPALGAACVLSGISAYGLKQVAENLRPK